MDDASLVADLEIARKGIIASGIFCYSGPDPVTEDLLAVLQLPPSVIVIETRLEDSDPISDPAGWRAAHAPNLPPSPDAPADSPMSASSEQRTICPPDPLMLERIQRMARRRQLTIDHNENWISLTNFNGEVRFAGTVAEVYEALKADAVTALPPSPAQLLRERLSRCIGWTWTLQDDGDGFYTLVRDDIRMYSGTLEQLEQVAASRILNTVENWGYQLGHPE